MVHYMKHMLHREVCITYKCKNIFTKMLKDVGIVVPNSIDQGQSAACMETKAGDDSMQQSEHA